MVCSTIDWNHEFEPTYSIHHAYGTWSKNRTSADPRVMRGCSAGSLQAAATMDHRYLWKPACLCTTPSIKSHSLLAMRNLQDGVNDLGHWWLSVIWASYCSNNGIIGKSCDSSPLNVRIEFYVRRCHSNLFTWMTGCWRSKQRRMYSNTSND